MKIVTGLGLAALSALLVAPVAAQTSADRPAATLLLPYFEVNLAKPAKMNTYISLNNSSAAAVMAHVTVWSDLSVPVLGFNVYLTGYDQQDINLNTVLRGTLPATASDAQDPSDTISPQGSASQDITFPGCTGQLPPAALAASQIDHIKASLTGKPSPLDGKCAGVDHGDKVARGYVTIDTVNNCTVLNPSDPTYFATEATNQNVLFGEYSLVSANSGKAWGDTLVHITADAANSELNTAGQYTFYGRYNGWTAIDNRQPLATQFGARYQIDGTHQTYMVGWRDPKVNQAAFMCPAIAGVRPAWYPLGEEQVVVFDDQEHPFIPPVFPVAPQPPAATYIPFPAATQRSLAGGTDFEVPFAMGWIYFNLNTTVAAAGSNPPEDPAASQAWVISIGTAGKYASGGRTIHFDSAENASHTHIGF